MSFATDLRGCFKLIDAHSQDQRKGTDELAYFFKELTAYEEAYAKGLDRIGSHAYSVTTSGTLAHSVAAFKQDCLRRAGNSRQLAENLTTDLIESLKEMLKTQAVSIKKSSGEGKTLEKQRVTLLNQLEKSRLRYIKACSDTEQITYSLETGMPNDKRMKLTSRLVASKKELDDSITAYQGCVESANLFKERYDVSMVRTT